MIWDVLMGLFAAFGVFCALWAVLGGWLTGGEKYTLVVHCLPGQVPGACRRCRYLRQIGLARGKWILVCHGVAPEIQEPNMDLMTPEQYLRWLEQERKRIDGT